MNVQTLVVQMVVGTGQGHHNGTPLKTVKDLYLCFEREINGIVDYLSSRNGPVTQGVVFAELLDAVDDMKATLREAVEKKRAKIEAEEAAEEAAAAAAAAAATPAPTTTQRRTRRTAAVAKAPVATKAPVGRKKPGVGRRPVAVAGPVTGKRRGRPPGSGKK